MIAAPAAPGWRQAKHEAAGDPKEFWSFELNSIERRFGAIFVSYVTKPSGGSVLEVDMSHFENSFRGSVVLMAMVPADYPNSRPVVVPVDRSGILAVERLAELGRCAAAAIGTAMASRGHAVLSALEEVSSLMQGVAERRQLQEVSCGKGLQMPAQLEAKPPRSRRRRRRSTAAVEQEEEVAIPYHNTSVAGPYLHCDHLQLLQQEAGVIDAAKPTTGSIGGSTCSRISAPPDSNSGLDGSSSDYSSSDSSNSSDSDEDEDTTMVSIALQLHQNVRRQMLFRCAPLGP